MRILSTSACLALSLLACGGSSTSGQTEDTTATPDVEPAPEPEESPEAKLARQQTDAVDKMCQRITDCAIEDAKTEMTPEDLAELESQLHAIVPKAVADCAQQYAAPMSPRQVLSIRECLGEATECSVFGDCVSAAIRPE